jgi:hypothetical protein
MSTHIKDILDEFIKKRKGKKESQDKVEETLNNILGGKLSKGVTIKGIYKNKIILNLNNSAVQYEVGLKKNELHMALREKFPGLKEIQLQIK